jgi:hypothetical protein
MIRSGKLDRCHSKMNRLSVLKGFRGLGIESGFFWCLLSQLMFAFSDSDDARPSFQLQNPAAETWGKFKCP